MIQAVIFDLDGTLLDRDSSLKSFVAAQWERLPALEHINQKNYIQRFIELDNRGHVWKDKVYQSLVKEFKITKITWQDLLNDYETQFINHCIPFPHLLETLTLLREQNYLLGMITNGRTVFQSRSIQGLGIKNYFDTILISETEQIRKPQPEIFHTAVSRLKATVETSVYIGDNPQADIIGAKRAGLRAIWKRDRFWLQSKEADATIDSLDEIPTTIKKWQKDRKL